MTLEELQTQRATLVGLRSSGALAFTDQNGERIEYQSGAALARAIAALDAEIAAAQGRRRNPITFKTSKGL